MRDKTKHSPAPWVDDGGIIRDANGAELFDQDLSDITGSEYDANTALVLASPDLLAACKEALEIIEDLEGYKILTHADKEAQISLRDAIAKAEGAK